MAGFIGCSDGGGGNSSSACKCPAGTEHLHGQACCTGDNCHCGTYYGVLPNGVKIYKGAGVTDEQMTSAVQNAIEGYNSSVTEGNNPNGKFTKLVIITGDKAYSWDAVNKIISVNCEAPVNYFNSRFLIIANGTIDTIWETDNAR